jgi:hypothetical protein
MTVIDEEHAWGILLHYTGDCLKIDSDSLLAVYATGSLPGGYYRPGQSDIDAVLIVKDGAQNIWGDSETPSDRLAALNRTYLARYKIPKDFGPFPLGKSKLLPPYDPDDDLLPMEIARLKIQGKLVYGNFKLDKVPMPTSSDFLIGAKHFEAWWDQEFSVTTSLKSMSTTACINTILIHLSRFLIIERDIFEFNKRKIISSYLASKPPLVNQDVFSLAQAHLQGQALTGAEAEIIRRYTRKLRLAMNELMGISD